MPGQVSRARRGQHPVERNHLQRGMTLLGLAGVLGTTLVLLVHADVRGALGIGLLGAGVVTGLAAWSRQRYVHQSTAGPAGSGDRGFVLGSAALVLVTAACVVVLVLD